MSHDGREEGLGYTVEFRELSPDRPARESRVLRVARGNLDIATVLRFTPDGQKLIVSRRLTTRNVPSGPRWSGMWKRRVSWHG